MMTAKEMADEVVQAVRERLPAQALQCSTHSEYELVTMPMSQSSDYDFELYCYGSGEGSLCAKPRMQDKSQTDTIFWYVPFESYRGEEGARPVFDYMKECVFKVISHPTRITHRKGLLFGSFRLESQINGQWTGVYKYSYLRMGVHTARVTGKQQVFSAEPSK